MYFIVGLGNPGRDYEGTRHNVGFFTLDAIKRVMIKSQISNLKFHYQKKLEAEILKLGEVMLVKPGTYMNKSGEAVQKVVGYFQGSAGKKEEPGYDNVFVVHDDLDIILGEYKIHYGKGPKQHGGVNSVEQQLGTEDFWRVRIGIDGRAQTPTTKSQMPNSDQIRTTQISKQDVPGEKYVLGRFTAEEREVVDRVIDEVVEVLVEKVGL